jgi:hypothetical protein
MIEAAEALGERLNVSIAYRAGGKTMRKQADEGDSLLLADIERNVDANHPFADCAVGLAGHNSDDASLAGQSVAKSLYIEDWQISLTKVQVP